MIDAVTTAVQGLVGAELKLGLAAGKIAAAPAGADLTQPVLALAEARIGFAANLDTLKTAESFSRRLLDIIA